MDSTVVWLSILVVFSFGMMLGSAAWRIHEENALKKMKKEMEETIKKLSDTHNRIESERKDLIVRLSHQELLIKAMRDGISGNKRATGSFKR